MGEQGAPGKTQNRSIQKVVEAGTGNVGGIWRHCPSMQE